MAQTAPPVAAAHPAVAPDAPPATTPAAFGGALVSPLEQPEALSEPTSSEADGAPPDAGGASPTGVLVTPGEEGVQVFVALPEIDGEAVRRLRAVIERLVGEFGLRLADFTLNGRTTETVVDPHRNPSWR